MASYDASGVMERTLVLSHAGFLADPKIGFLPDFWRRTMVKKLESIGEFGEGRPDFGGRRPEAFLLTSSIAWLEMEEGEAPQKVETRGGKLKIFQI